MLVKSVGFIWAVFGLVFLGLYQLWQKQGLSAEEEGKTGEGMHTGKKQRTETKGAIGRILAVAAAPIVTGGSWMLFCLLMRRVTKTTTTAVKYLSLIHI